MTRDNSKLHAAFPVHLVMALVAALVLVPFSSASTLASQEEHTIVTIETGQRVDIDDPDQSAHCLLWAEGKKMRSFSSVEKVEAHAAKMDRAARLIKAGRILASEVEDGVTAAACSTFYRYWTLKGYAGSSLEVCHSKADLRYACDDRWGNCGDFDNKISSWQKLRPEPWASRIYERTYYQGSFWWNQGDVWNLANWGWDNRASSLDIW